MTLAQALEDLFRGDIRFRGAALFKKEQVTITHVLEDSVTGSVKDDTEFDTRITRRDEGRPELLCSCAQEGKPFFPCKHLWATILAVDAGGLMTGTAKPNHIPPFVVESQTIVDDLWDDRRDVYTPPSRPRVLVETPSVPLKGWEAQIRSISSGISVAAEPLPAAAREREIFYEIDVPNSRDRRMIVVQTSQRQRRSNGQWGKRKPLKLRAGQVERLERDDDRRILAYLAGGAPERPNWMSQQAEMQASVHRYYLSFSLAEVLLPLLCETGRLCVLADEKEQPTFLEWDDGPAWELCLDVSADPEEQNWLLDSKLRRGTEVLSGKEAVLVVPGGFVVAQNKVAHLQDFDAFEWSSLLKDDGAVKVPAEEGRELVDKLLDMPQIPRLELPPDLKLEEIRATPVPHLTLHTPRGVRWQHERLQGEVSFAYDGARIRSCSPQGVIVQRDLGRCLPRDRPAEEATLSALEPAGFRKLINAHRGPYDVEIPAKQLGPAVRGLIKSGWQVHADGHQVHEAGAMKFQIKSGIDWFELHGQVDFEGRGVAFPELLAALARGDCTVRLSDGSLGILPEEWFAQFGLLSGLGVSDGDHMRFANNQVGLLDALLLADQSVDFDEGFAELRERVKTFAGIHMEQEPIGFSGELRQYQRDGFGWLRFLEDFRFGGCLADDMGLGKTVQLLALLQDRHNREGFTSRKKLPAGEAEHHDEHDAAEPAEPTTEAAAENAPVLIPKQGHLPTLVVVPKSLIFNWKQESNKFTPNLRVLEYIGLHRSRVRKKFPRADIVLTTYGTVRRDILQLKDAQFDYVVLDEAQTIKNAGSQVAKACRLLKSRHRLALSGTPIENRLSDLWSIFEFLNPGMLGRASVFRVQAADAAETGTRKLLSQALKPFILRRTKREVARDLPEKLEQTIFCTMSKHQETLYNELREHYRGALLGIIQKQGMAKSKIHVLEALLRLRQAACHPALLDESRVAESSAKLDVLVLQLQDLLAEGHKALVFSQFTSFLAIVKKHLDDRQIKYEYLDGQTRDRKERIEHFQGDPDCGVFLISLKAGGLGLNLTAADYVFLLDPWWNPAVEMQAIDRAHRLGQTRQVFAYRLICRNTVEEKIAELQVKKKDLADAILQADNNLIQSLSAEDLELLLS